MVELVGGVCDHDKVLTYLEVGEEWQGTDACPGQSLSETISWPADQ